MASVTRSIPVLILGAGLLLSGCGKKGPLIPPEALAPAPVTDLAVAQKNGRFEISWSAPGREEGGGRLRDLAGFLLFKRVVLPPSEDCEECPTAYGPPSRIDLDYLKGVERVDGLFVTGDTGLVKGKTYQYKLRSFNTDGVESKDSNKVRRTAVTAPFPPVLEALPSQSGVVVAFVSIPPEEGTAEGYRLYRAKEGSPMPRTPYRTVSAIANKFEDTEVLIGTNYTYWATSLAKVGTDLVESAPSNPATASMSGRD